MKRILFPLIAVLLGMGGFFAVAELALRLLPVNEGMRTVPVTPDAPVFHFEPNREANYAKGWDFAIRNRVHVNNAGFVNDQDYHTDRPAGTPLVAIVGDSYVEALMVPFRDTLTGRLQQAVAACGRVYSFAASGAGLAQYLTWIAHARDTYRPDAVTVVVIANDFSESLYSRERSPGFHAFRKLENGEAEPVLTVFRPSTLRKILRSSALARYLFTQVKVQSVLNFHVALGKDDARYVGNVEAQAPEDLMADARWATDGFLDRLAAAAGLPPDRIQLVLESVRPDVYGDAPAHDGAYWVQMRNYVAAEARKRGFDVVDLDPLFRDRYRRTRARFEFPTDGHWNGEGHLAAADAVMDSRVFRTLFPGGRCP